jgi:outer membrane lipoprotein SlyB
MVAHYSKEHRMKTIFTRTTRTIGLTLVALACAGAYAQTPAPVAAPAVATVPALTPEQIKAQQDMAAAQAAMDKARAQQDMANKHAADTQKMHMAKMISSCATCGTVTEIKTEKRKGSGGAVGIIGGAVAGGLLGKQVGSGDGKTVATVGGAVAGGYIGNEIQKRMNKKTFYITTIKMSDGSIKKFESEQAPSWAVGNSVKLDMTANTVTKL